MDSKPAEPVFELYCDKCDRMFALVPEVGEQVDPQSEWSHIAESGEAHPLRRMTKQ